MLLYSSGRSGVGIHFSSTVPKPLLQNAWTTLAVLLIYRVLILSGQGVCHAREGGLNSIKNSTGEDVRLNTARRLSFI